jgi:hypothetical protein
MGKLRNISGWIIAVVLALVLGALAGGCGKRVQEAGAEQEQAVSAEQEQKAEAEEAQMDGYNNERVFELALDDSMIRREVAYINDSIASVMEYDGNEWKSYFITKSGRKFGIDSVYYSEVGYSRMCYYGFIYFRDPKTENVGLFDRGGNVIIAAEYNYLGITENGMMVALKGAEKEPPHGGDCDHSGFIGGKVLLIDTLNNVLIENFPDDAWPLLNPYSIEKTDVPHSDTVRVSFLAKDGGYYSFIDFGKVFRRWLIGDFLVDLTPSKLVDVLCDTTSQSSTRSVNRKEYNQRFVADNFEIIKNELLMILNPDVKYLMMGIGSGGKCEDIYHKAEIRFSRIINDVYHQNWFDFLATDNGYKLTSLFIKTKEGRMLRFP